MPGDRGRLILGSINGLNPVTAQNTINIGFAKDFFRTLQVVFRSTGAAPWVPVSLQPLLSADNRGGWICTSIIAQADIANFGFLKITTCGLVAS